MSSKKFLSKKKTVRQTISISPALKEWIERYVNVNSRKYPEDPRFKSISAFYNYVMENNMNIFKRGKTLDDFDRFVDSFMKEFQMEFSFNATIPIYEPALKMNKYVDLDPDNAIRFLFRLRRLAYSVGYNPHDLEEVRIFIDRIRNYFFENKLTKAFNYEIKVDKSGEKPQQFIFEFEGYYKNISFENFKFNIAIFSVFGLKLTNLIYSELENYCRLELTPTYLYFDKEMAKKERINLISDNMGNLINYNRIIDDNDHYLWIKMAQDKDVNISFKNEKVKRKWIDSIVKDFSSENKLLKILKLFKIFHWINIENENELSFKITLSKEKDKKEREFLLEILSNYAQVSESQGKLYLE